MALQNQKDPLLSSKSSRAPTTMEELLAQAGHEVKGIKKGDQVEGIVSAIGSGEILIDIKGKTEGIVLEKDRKLYNELLSQLSVGTKVKAMVISAESDNGHAVLSLRREMMDKNWIILLDKKEKGEEIEVAGVELTRGGLLVETMGLRGFIPLSHLDGKEAPESLVGTKFKARILDLDRKERRIIFSQKTGRIDKASLKALLGKLKIGEEYKGTISGITNFGLFVKIPIEPVGNPPTGGGEVGEIEGLVHISEISWEKVDEIGKMFKIGEAVTVLVIGIDIDNGKLNLSLKKLTVDPWEEVAKMYVKDQTVTGKVSKVSSFGVFVSLDSGIEGLIHKSKIPSGVEFEPNERVECVVESVDANKRRIALVPLLKDKPVGYR